MKNKTSKNKLASTIKSKLSANKSAPKKPVSLAKVKPAVSRPISSKVVVAVKQPVPSAVPLRTAIAENGSASAALRVVVERAPNFKAGDKIVYPGHGVGEIETVRSTSIGGQEQQFYSITIIESGMKVMVPVTQAGAVGLRKIVDKKAIEKVYEILKSRDFKIDTQTWNRRFREYSQKIKTGSVYEIAVVLRDLSVLSSDKELSFGEKKMLDMAQSLLASEIAIAKARPQDKIVGELRALFN